MPSGRKIDPASPVGLNANRAPASPAATAAPSPAKPAPRAKRPEAGHYEIRERREKLFSGGARIVRPEPKRRLSDGRGGFINYRTDPFSAAPSPAKPAPRARSPKAGHYEIRERREKEISGGAGIVRARTEAQAAGRKGRIYKL